MTQQSSVIVSRIELLKEKELPEDATKKKEGEKDEEEGSGDEEGKQEDQYAEEVLIENLRGEVARINVTEIKPLNTEIAKQFILQQQTMKLTFPVFINDLLMIIDRRGTIHNVEVFRAVLNGYKIDMLNTQVPESEKDDDIATK